MSDEKLIQEFLESRKVTKLRPAFAQGCETKTSVRRMVRRDRKASA